MKIWLWSATALCVIVGGLSALNGGWSKSWNKWDSWCAGRQSKTIVYVTNYVAASSPVWDEPLRPLEQQVVSGVSWTNDRTSPWHGVYQSEHQYNSGFETPHWNGLTNNYMLDSNLVAGWMISPGAVTNYISYNFTNYWR